MGGLNKFISDPDLADVLDLLKKDIFLSLNCHAVGTIQSFDPTTQRVKATINYPKVFSTADASGVYTLKPKPYPVLIDMPLFILGDGKTFSLTFPIKKDATCVILFNDRDMDNWLHSGDTTVPPATPRMHSFADGIAFVGLRSAINPVGDYPTDRAILGGENSKLGVTGDLIVIANDLYTLKGLLTNLIDQIKNLVNATAAITVTGVSGGLGTSGPPANAATITAIATALTTTASQLGDLLE